jgi:hypothetical protein
MVTDKLAQHHLKRMPHPTYRPDLSFWAFFLFGRLKDKLIDRQYATLEELFGEVTLIVLEALTDLISRLFATWQERLQKFCNMQGKQIE